jgi:cytochrome P450
MTDDQALRQPYVFPLHDSPFSIEVAHWDRIQRTMAVGADLVTDESGIEVDFLSESDVEAVLTDPRLCAVAMPTLALSGIHDGPLHELWSDLMNGKDGAEHRRIRNLVAREFTPKASERHRAAVADIAERMADGVQRAIDAGGHADLWSTYAMPVSSRVNSRLVGIPEADAELVSVWAFDLVRAFLPFMSPDQRQRAETAAVEFGAYVDELLERLRLTPGDDIASALLHSDATDVLTAGEFRALVANLVFGGMETTAKAIASGICHLLEHDQYRALVDDPALIPGATSELLRFLPPSPVLARGVPDDLVCQHVALKQGQVAGINLLSACHDPSRYANPGEIDVHRDPGKQLAFGAGAHFCLGANLAKLTLNVAFETITRRFPTLQVDPDSLVWDRGGFAGVVAARATLA